MTKIDELYEAAQRAYAVKQAWNNLRVVGSRDDMSTIQDWYSYNMTYKPVTYNEYLKILVDQANGDIPRFVPIWKYDLPA